jgi:ABC-type lipoprotein export system ATPase subunit
MTDPLVIANGVSRRFGAESAAVDAVRDASCEIRAGDRIALTGPSGSGKSTLLHLLGGLDEPTAGVVLWPALGTREDLRPGKVANVFQSPSLLPQLTVGENVSLPLILQDLPESKAARLADRALIQMGLASLRDKLPEEISGGQAQRVAIARALAIRPTLLLADEPTGQLDSATAQEVLSLLLDALAKYESALVVATHDALVAERLSTVWEMDDGVLKAEVSCST